MKKQIIITLVTKFLKSKYINMLCDLILLIYCLTDEKHLIIVCFLADNFVLNKIIHLVFSRFVDVIIELIKQIIKTNNKR